MLTVEASSMDLLSKGSKKGFSAPFKGGAHAPPSCDMAMKLNSFLFQPNRAVLCM